MFRKIALTAFLILCGMNGFAAAQQKEERTVVNDARARQMLLGKHKLSLQWVSWDYFGTAVVTNRSGRLYLKGEQRQRGGSDFVRIDGVITEINARDFKFDGIVTTRVSHINGGEPCTREGEMTFKITGRRRYWRLAEMDNPCDPVTDYVDIFFK